MILRRCLARIQSAALSRALLTWVDETVERRRLKNVGAKVVLRFRCALNSLCSPGCTRAASSAFWGIFRPFWDFGRFEPFWG